jgi:hypothetical protein
MPDMPKVMHARFAGVWLHWREFRSRIDRYRRTQDRHSAISATG